MRSEEERAAWLAITAGAAEQFGVITQAQIEKFFNRRQVERRVRRGHLIPVARGVWCVAGSERGWRQRVMIACLAVGRPVAASHMAAGRLWELDGITAPVVHLIVPRRRSGRIEDPRVVVHHAQLEAQDVVERHRLPLTTPARTLVDLASVISPHTLARATDDALRRRLLTLDNLVRERNSKRRMRGVVMLDQIIERRCETGTGDSAWEDTVFGWIVEAGLPAPERQYVVEIAGSIVVLDMAYPVAKVAVEFDGFKWHGTRSRFDRDRVRSSELSAAGWRIVTITSTQGPAEVVDRVQRALLAATPQLAPVAPPW